MGHGRVTLGEMDENNEKFFNNLVKAKIYIECVWYLRHMTELCVNWRMGVFDRINGH